MQVTVVANGVDNYASYLGMLGGTPLETRLATFLGNYDQVLSLSVTDASRIFSILGGTYPFQATVKLETLRAASDTASVAERVRLAVTQATGHIPDAVSVVSAGQPMPLAPAPGLGDTVSGLADRLAALLNVTVETAKLVLVALGLGLIAVIYYIAVNPGRAARAVR